MEGDVCHMMCKVFDVDWCVADDKRDAYRSMQTWEHATQGSREQVLWACVVPLCRQCCNCADSQVDARPCQELVVMYNIPILCNGEAAG